MTGGPGGYLVPLVAQLPPGLRDALAVVSAVLLLACTFLVLRSLRRPRRVFLGRLATGLGPAVGFRLVAFARSLIPLYVLGGWAGLIVGVGVFRPARNVTTAGIGGTCVIAIWALVVMRTGRPSWSVPRAFRHLSEDDLVEWFGEDPYAASRGRRSRSRTPGGRSGGAMTAPGEERSTERGDHHPAL